MHAIANHEQSRKKYEKCWRKNHKHCRTAKTISKTVKQKLTSSKRAKEYCDANMKWNILSWIVCIVECQKKIINK